MENCDSALLRRSTTAQLWAAEKWFAAVGYTSTKSRSGCAFRPTASRCIRDAGCRTCHRTAPPPLISNSPKHRSRPRRVSYFRAHKLGIFHLWLYRLLDLFLNSRARAIRRHCENRRPRIFDATRDVLHWLPVANKRA